MNKSNDFLEMTFRSINCFANDGKLDVSELNEIVGIALKDGVVDANEKRVLASIISKLNAEELVGELADKVAELRAEYSF
jgi:20S proteasome alpha/beta subunit